MIGILFDLDGTLLDTLEDLRAAVNRCLASRNLPPRSAQEIRRFVGNGARQLIRRALPENTREETVAETLREFQRDYAAHCRVKAGPYAGIPEALAVLRERYAVAIVSNKPDAAVKALCAEFFPGVPALGETPDCPRKPNPAMVQRAMAALGVEKAIYVGDSEVDVRTAKNACLPCLSVTWGFRDRAELIESGAVCFCDDPRGLAACIDQMERKVYGQ